MQKNSAGQTITKFYKLAMRFFSVVIVASLLVSSSALAITESENTAIFRDSVFYDEPESGCSTDNSQSSTSNNCSCTSASASDSYTASAQTVANISKITWGSGVWGAGSTKFVSGSTGPYTLEYWAISVLKNIASKSGVSESTMVTPAKVLALVAFAKTEGGGISGHNGTYNPLNTKASYTDVLGVNQGNSANDSNSSGFKTFDDGVEASTRALFATYQKRVGATLLDPNMTPSQFMEAVTGNFYMEGGPSKDNTKIKNNWESTFKGDLAWASASITDWIYDQASYQQNNQTGIGNRSKHLLTKLQTLNDIKLAYEQSAKILLDYPNRQADNRPTPALKYSLSDVGSYTINLDSETGCQTSTSGGTSQNDTTTDTGSDTTTEGSSEKKIGDQSRYNTSPQVGKIISGNFKLRAYKSPKIRGDNVNVVFEDGKCVFDGKQPVGARMGEQPGSKAIQLLMNSKFGGGKGYIYNCRPSRGSNTYVSMHASGRAVDLYHKSWKAKELQEGNETMGWLIANAELIGLQFVVYWKLVWNPRYGVICNPSGFNQQMHSNHVHFDLNWDGALKKTSYFKGQPASDAKVELDQDACPQLYK